MQEKMNSRTLVSAENIPLELKILPHWVIWRYEESGGPKPKKVPYNPLTRGKAKSTDRSTWGDFDTTLAVYNHYKEYSGIGFVMTEGLGIVGIDVDGEVDLDLVDRFDSYSELTPSKNGLRIFIKSDCLLPTKKIGNFEFYQDKRFFTVTGERLSDATRIVDRSIEFEDFYNELLSEKAPVCAPAPKQIFTSGKAWYSGLSLGKILDTIWLYEKVKENKQRFEGTPVPRDKSDASWAEWHLAKCFAYHTRNLELTQALMLQSSMDKSKWAKNAGSGYSRLSVTCFNALNEVIGQYGSGAPNYRAKPKFVSNMNLQVLELQPI